ncbi:MAG: AAA family ATPase [Kiritimatiellae bacterium]|nr:AAA family ATPase [Kiritimatiellia bacterium]MDD4025524.1 AAA family ATPase [Kiritimatiellia bacterium]
MIRSHFGIERNPFDGNGVTLLPHQQAVFNIPQAHSRQGCLCVITGDPGTGKSVIKNAIVSRDRKKVITPSVSRTLHTYQSILKILCAAMDIEPGAHAEKNEKLLIEAAFKINSKGRMLVPVIDDAHLMEIESLRRLRLLFEDFPKNHNLVLIAQTPLMHNLNLGVNEDIRSRLTYSVNLNRLNPDDVKAFIFEQLDRIRLGHNTFSDEALDLIARSSEGILRRVRNLCVSALPETVRDRRQTVGLDQVNRVLMQPHWRQERDMQPH